MKTYAGSPTAAAAAAVAPARLPVEAQASAGTPNSTARAAATATARSLNDSDGLRVSSLIQSRSTLENRAESVGCEQGSRADRQRAHRHCLDRQELDVPPDPGRSRGDRLLGQRPGDDRQVVGHFQWPETRGTDVCELELLGAPAVATHHARDPPAGDRAAGVGCRCRCGCRGRQGRRGHDRSPGRSSGGVDRSWRVGQDPGRWLGLRRDPYRAGDLPGLGTLPTSRR